MGRAGGTRNVSRADAVAVGDGGESLDVDAQHPGEGFGLGLAQLGELLGDVGDRAVVLAELLAGRRRAGWRRHSPSADQRGGQRLRRRHARVGVGDRLRVARLDVSANRSAANSRHRVRAGRRCQEAERLDRQVVVRGVELRPTRVGQHEDPGRTAAAARSVDPLLARLDQTLVLEQVEVPADRGGGQPQPLGERRGAGRTVGEDRARDPVAGGGVPLDQGCAWTRCSDRDGFHNTSVLLFGRAIQIRTALVAGPSGPGHTRVHHANIVQRSKIPCGRRPTEYL